MSTVIMSLCWPLQGMSPSQKAVLISLADNANDAGVCWPSVAAISQRTCLSERAVRTALRWLEDAAFIVSDQRRGRSSWYTINTASMTPAANAPLRELPPTPAGNAAPPRQEMPLTPAADAAHPGSSCPQNRNRTEKEPKSMARAARKTRLPDTFLVTTAMAAWARDKAPGVVISTETEKFVNYWRGKGDTRADWEATWRTWMLKAQEYRRPARRCADDDTTWADDLGPL